MKILILGIGNILFGDEGIGVHLANFLKAKYQFSSDKHTVDIIDGGTLAHQLISIIIDYNYVFILDCVDTDDGKIGDVYFFDFEDIPDSITWQGSAHEVEMLQTLQMIELMEKLPTIKIVGAIPHNISQNSTFNLTDKVVNASLAMENIIIKELKNLSISVLKLKDVKINEIAQKSYLGEGINR